MRNCHVRILGLDCDLGIEQDHYGFGSTVSLFDYDVVFWNPRESLREYMTYRSTYRGKPSLREEDSARLTNDVSRRRTEFKDFLELGRCLVVFLPGDTEVYVDTGQREYSGTGKNRATTRIVSELDLMRAVPLPLGRSIGTGVEMVPSNAMMAALFRQTAPYWRYRCTLDPNDRVRPLLYVKGTQKVVAGSVKTKAGGLLLLLPELHLPWADDDELGDVPQHPEATDDDQTDDDQTDDDQTDDDQTDDDQTDDDQTDDRWPGDQLLTWLETLLTDPDSSLPPWTGDYRFPSEADRAQRLVEAENRLSVAQRELERLNSEQASDERWKTLMAGTGVALEKRVRDAFEVLGFQMEEGEPGRTDLRGTHKGQHLVVEVKGVTKSAAEKNAAQLEKWVSAELADGNTAKGILVVNTWRELPLAERRQRDFPDQMLAYSKQRGHCLLTGFQLLSLVRTALADPNRQDELAESLMTTVGALEGWSDLGTIFSVDEEPSSVASPIHSDLEGDAVALGDS